ncbi:MULTISPECIES: helix-turn-helix domain-containing protein [Bacillus cereus group]|uniref:XRE family transcriptional regulator n=1 Tax=Bacillus cereus TaxID=1396 RepID=A0A2B1CXW3_BACCE|nr:helix-turn-helix domain-containing protein [Bacillus cereus]PDY78280.1 XRE family transcriptional regulator [Bacillus cereus]PFA12489.1 XRE family transcriptional regulator [Bacillus cereus]PFM30038.1 XRE family transcriptional regulator [Bacillus cereus]PGL56842.1 XRE family transcriptional regulator [Bacillus cereus]PGQ04610.1 XRE family transcriptional regulator [Bacillus cereus]
MTGERIKELRKKAGLTQKELASGIITRSYLSQIEQGTVEPTYNVLEQLSKRLGHSVEEILSNNIDKDIGILEIKRNLKLCETYIVTNKAAKTEEIINKIENTLGKLEGSPNTQISYYEYGLLNWVKGKYHETLGDFSIAELLYRVSVEKFQKTASSKELMRSLDSLGSCYTKLEKYELATQTLKEAYRISVYEQIQDITKVSLLLNLGIVHGRIKEIYSAIHFLTEAVELNQMLGTYFKQGDIYMALGICYMEINNLTEAEFCYFKSLHFLQITDNKKNEAGLYTNLGILYVKENDLDKGIEYFIKSLALYHQIQASTSVINNTKIELAKTYLAKKDFIKVEEYCLEIIKTEKNHYFLAKSHELFGDLWLLRLDTQKAINEYNKALATYQKTNNKLSNQILKKLGNTYSSINDYIKAISFYEKINI